MVILKKTFLAMIGVCSFVLHADFININVWQRKTASDATQLLITMGDRHDKMNVGDKQAADIERFLAEHKQSSVIIEDALDYGKSIAYLASLQDVTEKHSYMMNELRDYQENTVNANRRLYVLNRALSPIVLIPQIAREHGIACENVEFRQLVTFQLPGLLGLIDESGYDHGAVIQEIVELVCQEIAAFNDMPTLNAYYQEVLATFAPVKRLLDQFVAETDLPMAEFPAYLCDVIQKDPKAFDMSALTYASPVPFLVSEKEKTLALHDALLKNKDAVNREELLNQVKSDIIRHAFSSLVDAYMLHALYQKQLAQDSSNITVLCAGLAHSATIEQHMQALGYKHIAALEDAEGVVIGDALNKIADEVIPSESNGVLNIVYAMVDGVKSAVHAVGSFFGLA